MPPAYNARDEVVSDSKHLADGAPVVGFGTGYAYDGIGNRSSSAVDLGAAGEAATVYAADALNRYAEIVHPARFPVSGRAPAEVAVSEPPPTPGLRREGSRGAEKGNS